MITRRDFIKGMGALAIIPFIPEMLMPETVIPPHAKIHRGIAYWTTWEDGQAYLHHVPLWDNTGTMTIPTREGRYKVKYTVHPDTTESEIVEE